MMGYFVAAHLFLCVDLSLSLNQDPYNINMSIK